MLVVSLILILLKLRSEENPLLLKWMEKMRDKFMSPDSQNEILSIMAHWIQQEITDN